MLTNEDIARVSVVREAERKIGRGFLIDSHNNTDVIDPCPFCGLYWYIAYLDNEWEGFQSSPDDVFECLGCRATITRRDGNGDSVIWDKDAQK